MLICTQFVLVEKRCETNPCQNLGICHETPEDDEYTCECRHGYKGKDCEGIYHQLTTTLPVFLLLFFYNEFVFQLHFSRRFIISTYSNLNKHYSYLGLMGFNLSTRSNDLELI